MYILTERILKEKSCSDQIFTLRQILEQSAKWNATIYANLIDFEKAFDSLLTHCGKTARDTTASHRS